LRIHKACILSIRKIPFKRAFFLTRKQRTVHMDNPINFSCTVIKNSFPGFDDTGLQNFRIEYEYWN
jgi:hypothetical protein